MKLSKKDLEKAKLFQKTTILTGLLIVLLLIGCQTTPTTQIQPPSTQLTTKTTTSEQVTAEQAPEYFKSDVLLTKNGFDPSEVIIRAGDSLSLLILDTDLNGHYLALDGKRVADKSLKLGEKTAIPFKTAGNYEVTDETSKAILKVTVQ